MNTPQTLDQLDAAHDAACRLLREAQARMDRSRSERNRRALCAAMDRADATAEACRAERDRLEREEVTARRLAVTAGRRALREAQLSIFT